MRANGWDWMATEAGLEIVEWGWGGDAEETSAASESAAVTDEGIAIPEPDSLMEPEPTVVRVIPWSELPFTYEEYTGGDTSGGNRNQMFLGDLSSGEVVAAEGPGDAGDIGQIVATPQACSPPCGSTPTGPLTLPITRSMVGRFSRPPPGSSPLMGVPGSLGSFRRWRMTSGSALVVVLRDGVLPTTSGSSWGTAVLRGGGRRDRLHRSQRTGSAR